LENKQNKPEENNREVNGNAFMENKQEPLNAGENPIQERKKKRTLTGKSLPPVKKEAIKKDEQKNSSAEKKTFAAVKKVADEQSMADNNIFNISLYLKFHTQYGQALYVTGNHAIFGDNNIARALPMKYLDPETWTVNIQLSNAEIESREIIYNYVFKK